MATAAKAQEARRAGPIALPSGYGDDKRVQISPLFVTPVQLTEQLPTGEVVLVEELPDLPLGSQEIYVQHRMCGDFYCFIHGARQVAAIGPTRADAFRNALAQVSA